MIIVAMGWCGAQILLAAAAWCVSPWTWSAWAATVLSAVAWWWVLRSSAVCAVAGGRWRRVLAVLGSLLPQLLASAWCLGGWWGWWPELDAMAVFLQGMLMPWAPLLELVPGWPWRVAPYLWVGALLPWILAVLACVCSLAWSGGKASAQRIVRTP